MILQNSRKYTQPLWHIPEQKDLQQHHHENLKSCGKMAVCFQEDLLLFIHIFLYLIILKCNFNFTWMLWLIFALYMLLWAIATHDRPFVSAADRDSLVVCTYEDVLKSSSLQVGSFDCPQCFKRYRWKKSLLRHMRLECGQEPSHFCPHCDWPFKHKHHLISHITLTHRKSVK